MTVNTNECGLSSVRLERSGRKAEERLGLPNGTTERGKGGGLGLRKTNVGNFMINFIHSTYRQELKLEERNYFKIQSISLLLICV